MNILTEGQSTAVSKCLSREEARELKVSYRLEIYAWAMGYCKMFLAIILRSQFCIEMPLSHNLFVNPEVNFTCQYEMFNATPHMHYVHTVMFSVASRPEIV